MKEHFLELTVLLDIWIGKPRIEYRFDERFSDIWGNKTPEPYTSGGIAKLLSLLKAGPGFQNSPAIQGLTGGNFMTHISKVTDFIQFMARNRVPADPIATGLINAVDSWVDSEAFYSSGTALGSIWGILNEPDDYAVDGSRRLIQLIKRQPEFAGNPDAQNLVSSAIPAKATIGQLYLYLQV